MNEEGCEDDDMVFLWLRGESDGEEPDDEGEEQNGQSSEQMRRRMRANTAPF